MSDFWNQLLRYSNTMGNESPDIDNPEHLLAKLLAHAENERQLLEVQVKQIHYIILQSNLFLF
jgi:hypothetical protein